MKSCVGGRHTSLNTPFFSDLFFTQAQISMIIQLMYVRHRFRKPSHLLEVEILYAHKPWRLARIPEYALDRNNSITTWCATCVLFSWKAGEKKLVPVFCMTAYWWKESCRRRATQPRWLWSYMSHKAVLPNLWKNTISLSRSAFKKRTQDLHIKKEKQPF